MPEEPVVAAYPTLPLPERLATVNAELATVNRQLMEGMGRLDEAALQALGRRNRELGAALDEIAAELETQARDAAALHAQSYRQEKRVEYAENARILADHLRDKWGDDKACPFCGTNAWLIDPSPVAMARADLPSAAIPAFLVMCRNCGFEVHISAETAGVYDVDRGAIERAKERREE